MAVAINDARDRLETGIPRPLFTIRPRLPVRLDAYPKTSPDGRRFVVNTLADDTTLTTITVVLNWTADLPKP